MHENYSNNFREANFKQSVSFKNGISVKITYDSTAYYIYDFSDVVPVWKSWNWEEVKREQTDTY